MRFNVVMGDASGDGHEKTVTYMIESNFDCDDIQKAYEKGCKIIGFDLTEDVAVNYGDSSLSAEQLKKLRDAGFTGKLDCDVYSDMGLSCDEFFSIWWFFVRTGNSAFECDVEAAYKIKIGGYGLFS